MRRTDRWFVTKQPRLISEQLSRLFCRRSEPSERTKQEGRLGFPGRPFESYGASWVPLGSADLVCLEVDLDFRLDLITAAERSIERLHTQQTQGFRRFFRSGDAGGSDGDEGVHDWCSVLFIGRAGTHPIHLMTRVAFEVKDS